MLRRTDKVVRSLLGDLKRRLKMPEGHWDLEADVVIAGFGFAGAVAAIAAVDTGCGR